MIGDSNMFFNFNKKPIKCGGVGCIEVSVKKPFGRKGYLYFNYPTYEEILKFEWNYTNWLQNDTERTALNKAKDESYAMAAKKLFIPFAKKIFIRSENFTDDKGNSIDELPIEEQFNILQKYYGYTLVDMATEAFKVQLESKKKF